MHLTSSAKQSARRAFPFLTTIAIAGTGIWILHPQPQFDDALAAILLARAPVVCPIVVGLAVGFAVWLLQQSAARQNELKAANRALENANEQLKQDTLLAQQTDQRFHLLFAANPCPMFIFDCDTFAIKDVNEAALQQYGYTRKEFLGLTALDLRPPEECEGFIQRFRAHSSGFGFRGISRHCRKDGTPMQVEICAFRQIHGGIARELVLAQDVTPRVEAEDAVKRSRAALKAMVDSAPFGICCTSLNRDCFDEFNPAAAEMLGGYTRDEMRSLRVSTEVYSDPEDRERMVELLRRGRRLNAFESSVRRKDGTTIRVRAWGVLRQENPDLLDVYLEDITEQSSLEQQVRQVQKLEAVGRLAGGIAHDFNNILVVIRLSTELMLSELTLDSPMSKPLLQILSASDRAAALTRQLLAFGRQQVMQARTINLNSVVSDTLRLLRRTIGEDIDVITHLDSELHNARLDPDQMTQVIMNLAINSRDAMPAGGTLEIETRNVELDQTYARDHGPVQPGTYVMLAVSDSGSGIDNAILPRIFDPFFTTKDLGKGTGLGLSIVYGIVKQSGGYVWVYSEPGHGTTFKLYFPITDSPRESEVEHSDPQAFSGGKTVLVVEDESQIRQNLCECLRQLGCQVIEAANGMEAIERFQESRAQVDLVLTDLVMPHMSGQQLWKRLTQIDPSLSFVFMSGYTEDSALRREILSQQAAFLNKPFSVADLSSAIQSALALQNLHPSEVS